MTHPSLLFVEKPLKQVIRDDHVAAIINELEGMEICDEKTSLKVKNLLITLC